MRRTLRSIVWLPVALLLMVLAAGCSDSSTSTPIQVAPPAAPVATAQAGNAQVTVSWSNVASATSYRVNWSTSAGVTSTTGTRVDNATSPCVIPGLLNGTTHYFVVTAIGAGGESPGSAVVSAQPVAPPPPPPSYTVDATNGNDTTGNGTTLPYKTLTKALSVAVSGSTVTVAPGTYDAALGETFPIIIPAGVQLIGDETNKGNGTIPTRIVGGGNLSTLASFTSATVVPRDGSVVAGFTITGTAPNPTVNSPMGLVLENNSVTIRNNRLVDSGKGGLYVTANGNSTLVSGNVIQSNGTTNNGFGIAFINGTGPGVRIENNVIRLNVTGVEFDAPAASGDLGGGATGSTGGNVIAANSGINLWTNVAVGVTISARNNFWDHVPPTITSSSSASGYDIYNQYGATVDTTGATLAP